MSIVKNRPAAVILTVVGLMVLLLAASCARTTQGTPAVTFTAVVTFTPTATFTLPVSTPPVPTPTPTARPAQTLRHLIILYTSDEHGWLEPTEESGGAAGLVGLWREKEGYTPAGPYLVLSGGDMWTGPAVSSWFKGESMVEVMNAMGYHAAALGNHDFDFGLDVLRQRAGEMAFPLLSANVRDRVTGQAPDGIAPYAVREVGGIRVGLIGLTTLLTPEITFPDHVAGLDFVPYAEALKAIVPQVKAEGARLLIVVGHICPQEMAALVPTAQELGIAVIGGGHCHTRVGQVKGGVALISGGENLEAYARADLTFDLAADRLVDVQAYTRGNPAGGASDLTVAAVVDRWRARADAALSDVIGYTEKGIAQHSGAMFSMITDAWLWAYPADVALTNLGGVRQALPAGEITRDDIVGVMPFNNTLVHVRLTGRQLIENIQCCGPAVGGMTTVGGYRLADGTPIDPESTFDVLVNDFIYAGGDGFKLKTYDPDAYQTGIDWRQPVIDWIKSLQTSAQNPLDPYLNTAPER